MKKILILLLTILLISCDDVEYIGQEIVDGKVSAKDGGAVGRMSKLPRIWIQSATKTVEVSIPFAYEDRFNIGDSCFLIIEKYKIKQ